MTKLARFWAGGSVRFGVVTEEGVIDIAKHCPQVDSWEALLAPAGRAHASRVASQVSSDYRVADVGWKMPLAEAARVFCVGVNYKSHAEETGRDLPPRPSVFTRTHQSLVDPGEQLLRPTVSHQFDFEGELAAVIGTVARNVPPEQALSHVAGYTCFNDGSVRDYQKYSVTAGKNFDSSGSCGPWLTTADEIPDPAQLQLVTRLNDAEVQRSGTDLLIYSVGLIISYLSEITELQPGDIVATGTPAGVGHRRQPQLWMKAGDVVEVEISGIGVLRNPIGEAHGRG
jgi:2-keto-4-pentenoate hydratase/2-oxohepta-3-ene-1,7-dioic acid hydratase in catechol pathway